MRLTEHVHLQLTATLLPGDCVIDATAGNGHDTLVLAERVGPAGKVFAIDRQSAAIAATRTRLAAAGQLQQCSLIEGDHAVVLNTLSSAYRARIAAITFNLGYLPGGEKHLTTCAGTTLPALDAASQLLRPGGILLVTAYRGHPGGMEEAAQVAAWMQARQNSAWHIDCCEPLTRDALRIPPILWIARQHDRKILPVLNAGPKADAPPIPDPAQ